MLNGAPARAASGLEARVTAVVLDNVAALCRVDRATLAPSTAVLDVSLDSLTLIALLTRIELAFGVTLSGADLVGAVEARSLGELCTFLVGRLHRLRTQSLQAP